jgi:hypothetical protein
LRPYLKKTHQKKRLVESLKWLEHMPSKHRDLSSNPRAVEKAKKKKKIMKILALVAPPYKSR